MYKYTTAFISPIRPIFSEEKDKYLAKASLQTLKQYIPDSGFINAYDILPIAGQGFNVNRFNKNTDGVDAKTAVAFYKTFINRPINLNHKRDKTLGCILTATLTEFGSDKIITEEEALKKTDPFNCVLGGIIWKVVNPQAAEIIEESNDILSEAYSKLFFSFEVGFSDFDIAIVKGSNSRNFEDITELVTDSEKIGQLEKTLKGMGGSGKIDDDTYVYRKLKGDLWGLGAAIVQFPAADVTSIAVKNVDDKEGEKESKSIINISDTNENLENGGANSEIAAQVEREKLVSLISAKQNIENNISQNEKKTVINDDISKTNKKIMDKLAKIEDLNDENIKECQASVILDLFNEKIKEISDKWVKDKTEKENLASELEKNKQKMQEETEKLGKNIESLSNKLEEMTKQAAAKEQLQKYNERLASLDEQYNLDVETRNIIAAEIKDLSDEAYIAYAKKIAVMLKNQKKSDKGGKEEDKEGKKEDKKEAKASVENVVDDAIDNADKEKQKLPNTSASSESVYDKYKEAFKLENCVVTNKNKKY